MRRATLDEQQVVDAAATMADADGLEATTLSALARRLGVRPPSLYKHVDSRAALVRLLAIRAMDDLTAAVGAAATGRSGAPAVHAAASAYRAYAHDRPGLYAASAPFGVDQHPAYHAAGERLLAVLRSVLRAWDLSEDATIDAIRALRSGLHGFVMLEQSGGFGLARDVDASFTWLVSALITGLEASPGTQAGA